MTTYVWIADKTRIATFDQQYWIVLNTTVYNVHAVLSCDRKTHAL